MDKRLVAIAVVSVISISCGVDGTPSGSGSDTAVSNTPGSQPQGTRGPQRVEPHDDLVDVRATTFDRFERRGERAIDLFFWSGIEECYGVDRIEVEYFKRVVSVTIFEGREPEAETCIELAVRKVVRVELQEPLKGRAVVDGGSSS